VANDRPDDRPRNGRGPVDPRVEGSASKPIRPANTVGDPLLTAAARPVMRRPPPRPAVPEVVVPVDEARTAQVLTERESAPAAVVSDPVAVDPTLTGDRGPGRRASGAVADPITAPTPVVATAVTVVDRGPVTAVPLAHTTTAVPAVLPTAAVPAVPDQPVVRPAPSTVPHVSRRVRWRARRPRVRKVSRVVRRIDPWTVFKISVIFWLLAYVILLVAGVLLWNLAVTTGTIGNVEGFVKDLFGLETFTFDGQKIFRASWLLGAVLAVAGTGLNLVAAVLFNLIADLVGGLRVTVLEEEVVLRERPITGGASRSRG
jgi:hypothetical protein